MPLGGGGRLGPYEVVGPLGAGGMGEVYLARDTRLGREVALKVLPSETARDPGRLARFEREARALAALNHPNIVTVHAIEEIEGRRVIAMERVAGRPLSALIGPGGLPLARVLDVAVPVADALAAAHERGVVHRDLKPANVMVGDEGRVKVLDFGLAKWVAGSDGVDSAAPTATRSLEGAVLGTVPYMAPEQLRGEGVDARSDIFSLGVMLYEMAAGERPFPGATSADLTAAILREEPPPLETARPDLPPRFVRLVARCLEKDPRRRIQSAADLRQQLQDLAEDLRGVSGIAAAAAAPSGRPAVARTGRRRAWTVAALVLAAAAAVAVWQLPRLRSLAMGGGRAPAIRSIAVLPFDNLTHDASQDYFVDGLHDALITELAKLGTFGVTSRNSVMRYRGKTLAMRDVARELGVDALLEGSVLRTGNRVRVTAQLIRGSTDEHVWAESYDRDLGDVLALLTDVSHAVAGQLQARLQVVAAPPAAAPLAAPPPDATPRVRPEAFEEYLRGREVLRQGLPQRSQAEAMQHFRQAVALDPGLARAWAALGGAAAWQAFFGVGSISDNLALAREAARKALALDPREGAAYGTLGSVELYFDWDFEKARADVERAVALSPHEMATRHAYADYLMVTGRLDESLEQVDLGRDANPTSPGAQYIVLFHTAVTRQPDAVRREVRLSLDRFPQMEATAHSTLGDLLWREGRHRQALTEYQVAMDGASYREFEDAFRRGGPRAARLAYGDRLSTQAQEAGRSPDWLAIAGCYAEGGAADRAFAVLERAFAARQPSLLHVVADPSFDSVRSDPRYDALLRRIGIPMARPAPR
jgi:eukaryotic-like serine/threonine-protein kinase